MKKLLSGLAVLAGVAAVTAYVVKKNEEKQLKDLDEGLLYDEEEPTSNAIIGSIELDEEEAVEKAEPLKDEKYENLTTAAVEHIEQEHHRLVEELVAQGDQNEVDRPIQHFVHFHTQEDADNFKKAVVNKGFVVSKGEVDFDLVVLHISPIDQMKLVANELFLADQAYANHGEYKGWHARVSQ